MVSNMPDFTVFDKTTLVTIASAAAAFLIVLGVGLTLVKNKSRTELKRQKTRGGKGWQNARRHSRGVIRSIRSVLRYDPKKFLLLLLVLSVLGIMRYTTPDHIRNDRYHSSDTTTYHYKRYEGGSRYKSTSKQNKRKTEDRVLFCHSPYIIDGDTFDCIGTRIRLTGIDAPEMPDHCRDGRRCTKGDPFAAKKHLQSLTTGRVKCRAIEIDHYGRTIARCSAGDIDLSCAMIASGHAVRRYSSISCP
jgi:hypothetical protein